MTPDEQYSKIHFTVMKRWDMVWSLWGVAGKSLPDALAELTDHDSPLESKSYAIMDDGELDYFVASGGAIALAYGHWILDCVALECCKVSAFMEPEKWGENLNDLDKSPLIKKMTLLFSKTKSAPTEYKKIKGYKYKKERIKGIDKLRQKIIYLDDLYRDKETKLEVPNVKGHIKYLENTCKLLMNIIASKYGLTVNQNYKRRWR